MIYFIVAKTIFFRKNSVSTNTVETVNTGVVPFFARFLEEQATQGSDPPSSPVPFTFKYPSDQEDV